MKKIILACALFILLALPVGSVLAAETLPIAGDVVTDPNMLPTTQYQPNDLGLSQLLGVDMGLRTDSVPAFVGTIIKWVLGLLGVVLVALIVYGGALYLTSAGNEDKVETGKKVLTYAIIGLVIIVAAFIIADYVISALVTPDYGYYGDASYDGNTYSGYGDGSYGYAYDPATGNNYVQGDNCYWNENNEWCCVSATQGRTCRTFLRPEGLQ